MFRKISVQRSVLVRVFQVSSHVFETCSWVFEAQQTKHHLIASN